MSDRMMEILRGLLDIAMSDEPLSKRRDKAARISALLDDVKVTVKKIKKVRRVTGLGIHEARSLLNQYDGDLELVLLKHRIDG